MRTKKHIKSQDGLSTALAANLQKLYRCIDFGRSLRGKTSALTLRQMQVLSFFNDSDVVYISDVSRKLNMSIQSVNNLVKRLEGMGYVERTQNDRDRRFSDIRLTAKGRQGFEMFRDEQVQTLKNIVDQFDDAERTTAVQTVGRAAELFQKAIIRAAEKGAKAPMPTQEKTVMPRR